MIKEHKMSTGEIAIQPASATAPSKVGHVRTFFEDPRRYLPGRLFDVKVRAETVAEMLEGIEFKSVIDIGCGDGTISLPLLTAGKRLTLLDLSTSMTKLAQSNVPAGLQGNVTCVNQDFMQAKFEDGCFDVVVCIGVLAHVDSVPDFLGKVSRVLKPGGVLVLEFSDCKHFTGRLLRGYQKLCALRKPRPYPLNALSIRRVRKWAAEQQLRIDSQFRYIQPLPFISRVMSQDAQYRMVRNIFGYAKRSRNAWLGNEYICLLTNERHG